jgi:hypothetical protein
MLALREQKLCLGWGAFVEILAMLGPVRLGDSLADRPKLIA